MAQNVDNLGLLRLAVQVVNDKNNPFKPAVDISVKDFDVNMNGKFMIDVVSSILSCIDPSFESTVNSLNKAGRLHALERLGFAPMTYDATPELVFKAVRKFFPQDDGTALDLSVFIMPQLDIMRAKQVVVFLMGYFIVSDQVHEKFETEWERLNAENQEKIRLYEEIEVLRNTIAEEVITLQSAKDTKPQLEEELRELETKLVADMKTLTTKEEICATEKKIYDNKAVVNKRLQAELDNILAEKDRLEGCIVSSPQEIEQLYNIEKQKCLEDEKKRSSLGAELKNMGKEELALSKVIDRAAQTVTKFEELIKVLQITGEKGSMLSNDRMNLENKLKEIEELQSAVNRVGSDQDHLQSEINKRMNFYDQQCAKLGESLQLKERNLDHAEFRCNEIMARLEEIDIEIYRRQSSAEQNMRDIHELMAIIKENVAIYPKLLERQIKQTTKLCEIFIQMYKN